MKHVQSILLIGSTLLLLSGCINNQPTFDPSETELRVIEGKSYHIPVGADPSPYVDAKVIKFYQEIGLKECKEGDMTWEEMSAKNEMSDAIKNGDKGIYHKLAKQGRIGCASPVEQK